MASAAKSIGLLGIFWPRPSMAVAPRPAWPTRLRDQRTALQDAYARRDSSGSIVTVDEGVTRKLELAVADLARELQILVRGEVTARPGRAGPAPRPPGQRHRPARVLQRWPGAGLLHHRRRAPARPAGSWHDRRSPAVARTGALPARQRCLRRRLSPGQPAQSTAQSRSSAQRHLARAARAAASRPAQRHRGGSGTARSPARSSTPRRPGRRHLSLRPRRRLLCPRRPRLRPVCQPPERPTGPAALRRPQRRVCPG